MTSSFSLSARCFLFWSFFFSSADISCEKRWEQAAGLMAQSSSFSLDVNRIDACWDLIFWINWNNLSLFVSVRLSLRTEVSSWERTGIRINTLTRVINTKSMVLSKSTHTPWTFSHFRPITSCILLELHKVRIVKWLVKKKVSPLFFIT